MSDTSGETAPTQPYPPAPAYAPRPPRRPLPGWGWGLIIAGTAIVALLIGGGFGVGAGLIASHLGQVRTSVVHPGFGGMNGGAGGTSRPGFGGRGFGTGSGSGTHRLPGAPASPAPSATPGS